MALSTTNLTGHWRADRTNGLFTTYSSSGTHTGVPSDGSAVQVWDDEGDGISDVALRYKSTTGQSPAFRTSTPLTKNSCLDFDGSTSVLQTMNQTGLSNKALSSFIANNAFTIAIAFYPEAITANGTNFWEKAALLSDVGAFVGLHVNDASGVKQVYLYNWDGAAEVVIATISVGHTWIVFASHSGGQISLSTIDESGTKVDATPVTSGNTTTLTNAVQVGSDYDNSNFFNGRIGEVAIWNAAISGTPLADSIQYFKDQWLASNAAPKMTLLGVG